MKKYLLSLAVLMMGTAFLTSCDDNDSDPIPVPVVVSNGAYVVCGGNESSNINGSLSYIDYNLGTASQNLFKAMNGRNLGLTPNDAVIYGEKMYIAVSGENTIEVVDAKTLKSLKQIKTTELMGADKGVMPRHLTAYAGCIFVSTYGSSAADWSSYTTSGNGYVAAIDTINYSIANIFTAGSYPEGIAIANNKLYVANSDYSMGSKASISVIDLSTGTDTPIVDASIVNPTAVGVAGTDVFVLDMGNYYDIPSALHKCSGGKVMKLFEATHASFMGTNIYACNSVYGTIPTEFYVYDINTNNKTICSTGLNGRFFSPNVIAADPVTGKIYIASYNENSDYPGYANYSANGYVAEYSAQGTLLNTYDCGVGPNAIVFNTGIEYVK